MPVDVPSSRLPKAWRARDRRVFRGVFAVLFTATIVLSVFEMIAANRDTAQAAAFAAAPYCASGTVPVGNCVGWEQETVSSVVVGRGGTTTIHLNAGAQSLWYQHYNTFASNLTSGASVPVLVWRNQAEALRLPDGEVLVSEGSARLNRYNDICVALWPLGMVVVYYVAIGCADAPPLRLRRPRLWSSLSVIGGSVGVGLFVAGVTMQGAHSLAPGITWGAIAFTAVAFGTPGILALGRRRRLQRQQRLS